MRILTVVGARPQFIKAAAVSRVMRDQHADQITEVLVHTSQHFDENMSQVFFDELDIPTPQYNLEISGGSHGAMTGRMLEATENILTKEKPDWVLVYGDTNSTLAAALAAAKIHIPIAHIEAGLRSFDMRITVATDVKVVHDARRASHRELRHAYWHLRSILIYFARYLGGYSAGRSR